MDSAGRWAVSRPSGLKSSAVRCGDHVDRNGCVFLRSFFGACLECGVRCPGPTQSSVVASMVQRALLTPLGVGRIARDA